MEDFKKFTNSELISGLDVISQNHERIKQEILMLHETLLLVEQQYVEMSEELKNRK